MGSGICNNDVPPIQDIEIQESIVHENFDAGKRVNDIALIRLISEVNFEIVKHVRTICLPVIQAQTIDDISETEKPNVPIMTITGWGQTESHPFMSDEMMIAQVPYVSHEKCVKSFSANKAATSTSVQKSYLVKILKLRLNF